MRSLSRRLMGVLIAAAVVGAFGPSAAMAALAAQVPKTSALCVSCHRLTTAHRTWTTGIHRAVTCIACHSRTAAPVHGGPGDSIAETAKWLCHSGSDLRVTVGMLTMRSIASPLAVLTGPVKAASSSTWPTGHPAVVCARCHELSARACSECHAPAHEQRSGSCATCHTSGSQWRVAHTAAQTCSTCHAAPDAHYATAPCQTCHAIPHSWTFSHPSSAPCASCHTPTHEQRGECSTCHTSSADWTVSHAKQRECATCHAAPPRHDTSVACRTCHARERSWKFTHPAPAPSGSLACASCHAAPRNHFPGSCASCHRTTASWSSAAFRHPPTGGEHTYRSFPCVSCHPRGYTTHTCTSCHEAEGDD